MSSEAPTSPTTEAGTATPTDTETASVIAPPPLIYLGALVIGFGLDTVIVSGSPRPRLMRPVGSVLILAGTSLIGSFARTFRGADTPIDPYTPTRAIVTGGPYRLSRNPAYLGMALTYAGIAMVSKSPWALLPLPAAVATIDRGVIAREERYLERKFGAPYAEYKARVRRWL